MLDHVIATSNLTVNEFILILMGSSSRIQEISAPKVTVYREQGRRVRHAASEYHKFEQEWVPNQDGCSFSFLLQTLVQGGPLPDISRSP